MTARYAFAVHLYAHRVEPFDNGMYVVADDRGDAILIDPSRGEREAMATIRAHGLRILEILNTHGHQDHVFDNARMQEQTRARIAIHAADAYRLDPATRPASQLDPPKSVADDLLADGPLPYLRDVELRAGGGEQRVRVGAGLRDRGAELPQELAATPRSSDK